MTSSVSGGALAYNLLRLPARRYPFRHNPKIQLPSPSQHHRQWFPSGDRAGTPTCSRYHADWLIL